MTSLKPNKEKQNKHKPNEEKQNKHKPKTKTKTKTNKKIALCFLTYGNVSQPKLWSRILENKDNSGIFNAYIHNKNVFKDDTYNMHKYCLPRNKILTNTEWGHISLVSATLVLFEAALEDDPENEFFILVSDKCVPIRPLKRIHEILMSDYEKQPQKQIVINRISKSELHRYRHKRMFYPKFFDNNQFFKQSQWMLLDRKTTQYFTTHDFTALFGYQFPCSDEHYFVNICTKMNIEFQKKLITHVSWGTPSDNKSDREFPKTYEKLTNEHVQEILQKNNGEYLFMRKIRENCVLPDFFETIC